MMDEEGKKEKMEEIGGLKYPLAWFSFTFAIRLFENSLYVILTGFIIDA